jgi:hypothetical protein
MVGIDLGDPSSPHCILDEQGEVLAEGSVAKTKKGFAQVPSSFELCQAIGNVMVVLSSVLNSYAL